MDGGIRVSLARGWRARGLLALLTVIVAVVFAAPAGARSLGASLSVEPSAFSAAEGQPLTNEVATFFGSFPESTAGVFTASIAWGDGTVTSGTVSGPGGNGPWTVTGDHTYAEEGSYTVFVSVVDNAVGAAGFTQELAQVSDAALLPIAGTPTEIAGGGSAAAGAMGSFEAAIGGGDNGTTPGDQNGGFRHITWDGVAVDGSDPGSTSITPGHVVSVASHRVQPWGVELGRGVAVANDGFASVNPSANGKFPPFSSPNVFAPFNSNRIPLQIVSPAPQTSAPTPATTRGFGIMFLNVWSADTASIEYFNGSALLYTAFAPVGGVGQPSFIGVVFPSAAVTSVVVTMGTAEIFSFDGTTATSGPSDDSSSGFTDLVAGDDVVLAEPSSQGTIQATAGVPVSGVLDTFRDTDPAGSVGDYAAAVNWGDHTESGATISPYGSELSVTGSHTFTKQGTYGVITTVTDSGGSTQTSTVTVDVGRRSSSTRLACSPSRVAAGSTTKCTAIVTDVGPGTSIAPTGPVFFGSGSTGGTFPKRRECNLSATRVPGRSKCSVGFVPSQFPPRKAQVAARYDGDAAHTSSIGKRTVSVSPGSCSIMLSSTSITSNTTHLPVVVKCQFIAQVNITIVATIAGQGSAPGTQVTLASLQRTVPANKSTKLQTNVRPAPLKAVVAAAQRGQGISLELTLVGTPHSQPVQTSVPVGKVHVS